MVKCIIRYTPHITRSSETINKWRTDASDSFPSCAIQLQLQPAIRGSILLLFVVFFRFFFRFVLLSGRDAIAMRGGATEGASGERGKEMAQAGQPATERETNQWAYEQE